MATCEEAVKYSKFKRACSIAKLREMCDVLRDSTRSGLIFDKIDKFYKSKSESIKWEYYDIFKPSINTLCDLECGIEESEEKTYNWAIKEADKMYDKILGELANAADNFRKIILAVQSPWKKIVK